MSKQAAGDKLAEDGEGITSLKMLNMKNNKKRHCEICNETFKNESTFLEHIR